MLFVQTKYFMPSYPCFQVATEKSKYVFYCQSNICFVQITNLYIININVVVFLTLVHAIFVFNKSYTLTW